MSRLLIVLILTLFAGCNSENNKLEIPADFEVSKWISIMKSPEMLSKEKIAKIVETDASQIQLFKENFSKEVEDHAVLYSWPNGERTAIKTIDGKDLTVERKSSIGFGFLEKITKEEFIKKFESKTAVQDQINKITQDENINADIAISEAKTLAENAKIQQFEKIGEGVYWETPVNALHVFSNGFSFILSTNLGKEDKSKKKAIALAELLFKNDNNLAQ